MSSKTVIVVESGVGETSWTSGRGCLHFTMRFLGDNNYLVFFQGVVTSITPHLLIPWELSPFKLFCLWIRSLFSVRARGAKGTCFSFLFVKQNRDRCLLTPAKYFISPCHENQRWQVRLFHHCLYLLLPATCSCYCIQFIFCFLL